MPAVYLSHGAPPLAPGRALRPVVRHARGRWKRSWPAASGDRGVLGRPGQALRPARL